MSDPRAQQIACVTLATADVARSRRFYVEGFGWSPVFEQDDIVFYQMNGLMLSTWNAAALAEDSRRPPAPSAGFALAHNVMAETAVDALLGRLLAHGGTLLRAADAPPYGGRRGYVADPDGHAWEIAYNPAWPIDDEGRVTFGV